MITVRVIGLPAFLVAAACGVEHEPPTEPCAAPGESCLLPWPPMAHTALDLRFSATEVRVRLPSEPMPRNGAGATIAPPAYNRWDGFSPLGPMLARFATGVAADGLPAGAEASLAPESPIVLLDVDTGVRAPFSAELDDTMLILRPLRRLRAGGRYVVAIRRSLRAADGGALQPAPGRATLGDPAAAALAAAGLPPDELALAWDFVTASNDFVRSDLWTMRNAALEPIGPAGANLTFTLEPRTTGNGARYAGTFDSPSFLTGGGDAAVLHRDEWEWDGRPMFQGMRSARFAVHVPACVATQPLPRPAILVGHALFGSAETALDDALVRAVMDDRCAIVIAGEHLGLTDRDRELVLAALRDLNQIPQVTEKLAQGVIDLVALQALVRGPLSRALLHAGQPVIDPTRVAYVGRGLGAITGATVLAYDPDLARGVLAGGGGSWPLVIERSATWAPLRAELRAAYQDPAEYQIALALLGMAFEPYDPVTTATLMTDHPLIGSSPKAVLMQYALGDRDVDHRASELLAREAGLPVLAPSVTAPWGLPLVQGPMPSGLAIYDEGVAANGEVPPAARRQIVRFLDHGEVAGECALAGAPAPCACATGACD